MTNKTFAETLIKLRKEKHMTQSTLAERLNVSNKTISKWECGMGYPDITLLPILASVLGVSVDYLINSEARGICIAGNILIDVVKHVDVAPEVGVLSTITSISKSVGGCVPNTAINLAKIDDTIPITAFGCVGDDDYSYYIMTQLRRYNIDTSHINVAEGESTGFSDVIQIPGGEQLFFHTRGANAKFSPEDLLKIPLSCSIFHFGHYLMVDQFEQPDSLYGTALARLFAELGQRGIKTSLDLSGDHLDQHADKLTCVLKYSDYVFLNEIESLSLWKQWDIPLYTSDGRYRTEGIKKAMERTMAYGIGEKLISHFRNVCFCLDKTGEFTTVPSMDIPKKRIRGNDGAGTAYCAGALYAIYNNYSDEDLLRFASAAAACNLFSENAVDGMSSKNEIRLMEEQYPRKELAQILG